jgi:hypothetical protein
MSLTSKKILKIIDENLGKDPQVDDVLLSIKEEIQSKIKKEEIDLINRLYTIGYYDKEMSRKYKSNYYESELRPLRLNTPN